MVNAETKLHNAIDPYVTKAKTAQPDMRSAQIAINCLDLTSLTGAETDKDIDNLCTKAIADNAAAVCLYPEHIQQAANILKDTDIAIATVINFPTGWQRNNGDIATIDTTRTDILEAVDNGATEIDIVADFEKFKSMENGAEADIRDMIQAAKEACGESVKLKVIVESAAFGQLEELQHITELALESGADFVKTSTGKHEDGGADLESVAVMALTVKKHNELSAKSCGLKISGGVNGRNYPQFIALTQGILATEVLNKEHFRFGASGVYADLKAILNTGVKPAPRRAATAHSY